MGYILVINDDGEELEKIRLLLSVWGYRAKFFRNWAEARSSFDSDFDWDLVVTRVTMGEVNGNDIAQYIRKSRQPQTPILAIGRTGDNIDRNLFNAVLMTPCKLNVLGEKVAFLVPPPLPMTEA